MCRKYVNWFSEYLSFQTPVEPVVRVPVRSLSRRCWPLPAGECCSREWWLPCRLRLRPSLSDRPRGALWRSSKKSTSSQNSISGSRQSGFRSAHDRPSVQQAAQWPKKRKSRLALESDDSPWLPCQKCTWAKSADRAKLNRFQVSPGSPFCRIPKSRKSPKFWSWSC